MELKIATVMIAFIITWCTSMIVNDIRAHYGRYIRTSYRRLFK